MSLPTWYFLDIKPGQASPIGYACLDLSLDSLESPSVKVLCENLPGPSPANLQ